MNFNKRLSFYSSVILLAIALSQETTILANDFNLNTSLNKPIDYSNLNIEGLLLPRNLFVLSPINSNLDSANIFYNNAILSNNINTYLTFDSLYGSSNDVSWSLTNDTYIGAATSDSFDVNVTLNNNGISTLATTNVELVNTSNTEPIRLLAIGDSLTRAGSYLKHIENVLPNATILGTRFYEGDGMPAREGRGGWTLDKYFTAINSSELDSPFIFPANISGKHYKGNTRDWKNICYYDSNNHVYDGFQKIARNWRSSGPFVYDLNGYYKYPLKGDVMVDPSYKYGSLWIEWDGTTWSGIPTPTNYTFDFSKYMDRFNSAFQSGKPTHVSILLGANDFGYSDALENMQTYIGRLNEMITSIKAYDKDIKIVICTPTLGPDTTVVTDTELNFYQNYDQKIKKATYYLLQTYDNANCEQEGIYIAPMHLTLDVRNGFDYSTKLQNNETVMSATNGIHPNNEYGQIQMGNTLAAVLQKYR